MNHCKDCRHWDEEYHHDRGYVSFWDEDRQGWGECLMARFGTIEDGKPEHRATLAHGDDGAMYRGHLITKPEFGCVMFEAKE